MISIQTSSPPKKYIANILPCRVKYTGVVNTSPHLWSPQTTTTITIDPIEDHKNDTTSNKSTEQPATPIHTSYFRGRKLIGTSTSLPKGYTGHILEPVKSLDTSASTQKHLPARFSYGDEEEDEDELAVEDEEEQIETTNWKSTAQFNEIMLWNHEASVDSASDGVMRGVQEWIRFANAIHGLEIEEER